MWFGDVVRCGVVREGAVSSCGLMCDKVPCLVPAFLPLRHASHTEHHAQGLLQTNTTHVEATPVTREALHAVHTREWVARSREMGVCTTGELILESKRYESVFLNESSLMCAELAAGGTVNLTKKVHGAVWGVVV